MQQALIDLLGGFTRAHIWLLLGWHDIRQRYRRSVLGPFWITLSTGVMVGGMGVVYAQIFAIPYKNYLPFLACGLIVWGLISTIVNEAATVFIAQEGVIKQINLPFTVHVLRMVWRNIIVFAHNIVIIALVWLWVGLNPGANVLWLLPALLLLALTSVAVAFVIGILCTRFRDIPQIIANITQLAFFITPVIWEPKLIQNRKWIIEFNPFHHFLEIVRAPLLGQVPALDSWLWAVGITLFLYAVAFVALAKFRHRIAYWL